MPDTTTSTPSPYQPRLGSVRDVRRELVRIYWAAKRGEIEVQLVGKLIHALNSLVAIDRECGFEERIVALEEADAERTPGRLRQ